MKVEPINAKVKVYRPFLVIFVSSKLEEKIVGYKLTFDNGKSRTINKEELFPIFSELVDSRNALSKKIGLNTELLKHTRDFIKDLQSDGVITSVNFDSDSSTMTSFKKFIIAYNKLELGGNFLDINNLFKTNKYFGESGDGVKDFYDKFKSFIKENLPYHYRFFSFDDKKMIIQKK